MLIAIGNKIVVKKISEKYDGILVLPTQDSIHGTVLSAGSKVKNVRVGDIVHFSKFSGDDISDDTLVMSELDVLGVSCAG